MPVRPSPPHIFTLVVAAGVGPLAMNVFIPSLPNMAVHFQADYAIIQLTVSIYLAATAVLQLGIGPASDRFGRRPVLLFCFSVFLLATVAAILAPTIEMLLLARVFQAFAAAGMVLSRAIVRDTVGTDEAASRLGYVTMGMAMVPMVAPVIGGFLDEAYGWQANFYLILAVGLLAFVIVYTTLPETNHRRSSSMMAQLRTYPELFRSRRFWGYSITSALTSGTFFAFLGGGPYVATEMLQLRPSTYGFFFAFLSAGYVVGNYLSGRFSRNFGINTMMLSGNLVSVVGMLIPVVLLSAGYFNAWSLFGPVALVGVGNGMTLPNANAGMVSIRPHLAGSASGLGGSLQIGGGAVVSVFAGALLSPTSGPWPLVWVMLATSVASVLGSLYVIAVARRAGSL